jgi:bifunctional non-homologous end joining protein LigD
MPLTSVWREPEANVRPMLASATEVPLTHPDFVYEPKYDGVRTLARVAPGRPTPTVALYSRVGNDKTAQFPAIVRALQRFALKLREPLLLDGEIVALDGRGEPVGFQKLQGRIHRRTVTAADDTPSAFIAFDLLRDGPHDLRGLPLTARRAALDRVFNNPGSPLLRIAPQVGRDARQLYQQAMTHGWEGLIAKRAGSKYLSGKRSPDWAKLKLQHAQEFVVGGWTEPRGARPHFGALLVGVYDEDARFLYAGHVGTGFTEAELTRLMRSLRGLEVATCPFDVPPPATNETAHWVRPSLVAQVRFTEWTDDDKLRHPAYLGLRDDVDPRQVRREEEGTLSEDARQRLGADRGGDKPAGTKGAPTGGTEVPPARGKARRESVRAARESVRAGRETVRAGLQSPPPETLAPDLQLLLDQLSELEASKKAKGLLVLPDGDTLEVGNLHKIFWPAEGLTKGALLRYYVQVSPQLLPVVRDRPLVMKRYPNGVRDDAFYQHRAPDKVPPGVRIEVLPDDDVPSRPIGGTLKTLLYMSQLAAISQDPWFSRVQSLGIVDFVALDLDPMPGTSFETVLDVARWVRDALDKVGATGVPKTSGSNGLHVFVPMPKGTSYESGRLWAQIVATLVAAKHPKHATVERSVRHRGAKVYVDYLQNIEGKTLASAYSARASEFAGASAPLTWKEVDAGVDRRDFTIRTLPARIAEVGDLWGPLHKLKPPDLGRVEKYLK